MRSLIIHLPSSTQRRPNVDKLLRDLPNAEIVDAVDGRDPAQIGDVQTCPGTLHRPAYPFGLRPGEIGLFQSHRACWRKLVDSGEAFALIAEDDLAVDPDRLNSAIELIARQPAEQMFVRLPVKQREQPARTVASHGDLKLILPKRIGLQTVCQIVGRDAAKRLLDATEILDRPVDTFIQMHWVTGQAVHSLLNCRVREVGSAMGGSTIQAKTSGKGKLRREFLRACYRTRVALRPQH